MSDKDEKDNIEKETSQINKDGVPKNPETLSEGNVLSSDLCNKNNSTVTEIKPHSPLYGSGDNKEVSELDLIEAELTEMSKELNMDAGEGSGSTAKVKVGKDAKIMDILIAMDTNASKTDAKPENDEKDLDKCDDIKSNKTGDEEEIDDEDIQLRWDDDDTSNQLANDEKNDNILSEDQLLEDSSDVLTKDTNPKSVTVKDDNEEKKFATDDNSKEIETPKESETSLKLDIPTEKTEDEKSLEDVLLGEPDVNTEDINSPEMIFSAEESMDRGFIKVLEGKLLDDSEVNTEKDVLVQAKEILEDKCMDKVIKETEPVTSEPDVNTEDINSPEMIFSAEESMDRDFFKVLEDKLLDDTEVNTEKDVLVQAKEILEDKCMDKVIKETEPVTSEPDVNTEDINSPEMIFSAEESMDRDFIKVLEDKLLDDSEVNPEKDVLVQAKEILEDKCMDKVIKETEPVTSDLSKNDANDKETKDNLDIIKEAELLEESESKTEAAATLKMTSFTDVVLNEDNADGVSEEKPNLKDEISVNVCEKDIESDIPVKELPTKKDIDDDDLLEEELLEETEAAKVVPENDVTMEVDDEREGELLKDDKVEDDGHTPMDVDVTDPSTEDKVKVEDKIIDQPMAELSVVEKEEKANLIDDQTSLKKVDIDQATDEVQDIDETDKAVLTEIIIDQPVEGTTKTVEVIPVGKQSETSEINKESAIENQSKIEEESIDLDVLEKEHENQSITDNKKIEGQNTIETDPAEPSIKSPKETLSLTISNTEIEEPDKSITDKNTLDKEIVIGKDPEQPELATESVHEDVDSEKTEKSKEFAELHTSLDKNDVTTDDTPTSTIFRDNVSPIKGMHGLNKPDMMLEIPSQELIDMDCTDLSLNLDGLNDSLIANIKTEDDIVTDEAVDTVKGDDETIVEKSVDTTKADDNTVSQNTVDQVAVSTETKIDEITAEKDTVNEKLVDQQTTLNEATVDEVQTENNTEESDKKEETVVQPTVEENMERMFANDEPEVAQEVPECIASTSNSDLPVEQPPTSSTQMTPDTSDELPEVSDSLGLLAESAGRMMDDEEGEDDDDGDDDDDFDQDESSNQVSAEQSEDSNPAALESEPVTEAEDKELETPEPKEGEFPFLCNITSDDKEDKMDIEEFGTIELQAETIQGMTEEAKSAVDALLNVDNTDDAQEEDSKETADQMDVVKLSDISDNELDIEPTEVTKPVTEASKEGEEKQNQSPSKSPADVSPKKSPSNLSQSPSKQSPSKMKNLAITTQIASAVVNIVDLEESSSSEDDVQETAVQTQQLPEPETTDADKPTSDPDSAVTTVNIPTGIDIMCTSGGNTSEITTKEGEVTISGVPKPPPHRPARLNTSEVSIKTVSSAEPMVIPETKINEQAQSSGQSKPKLNLEIFSLDSDEDDSSAKEKSTTPPPHKMTAVELEKARETSKCVNYSCTSDSTVPYRVAETAEVLYYDASRKRHAMICQPCADVVAGRTKNLIQGIKDMTPLLDLDMDKLSQDLVEISDSESEEDYMSSEEPKETIGEEGAKVAEGSLAKFLNETWQKYNMDARLKETQIMLDDEIEKLEQDSKEIDAMLNECQAATDKLRCELYATFECRRQHLPALLILDTPDNKFIGPEEPCALPPVEPISTRQAKRRLSSTNEVPAKRPAIPLGYAPLDSGDAKEKAAIPGPETQMDDDKEDISVVKLSAESAPPELPPPGEISRPPLRVGMPVYAMKNAFGPWFKGRVLEIQPKNASTGNPYSFCRVRFDHKAKTNGKVLKASSVAYSDPADVRMTIGTRLIALIKDSNKRETYYAGVVAEIPNPVNSYRYLVFFDDGYAQYVQHQHTRLVCESSPLVWEEVHQFSRDFVREYLLAYPERPMVRLHKGQHLKTEWNGKWWSSRVTEVDASLAQVLFVGDGRREWIYRGSTRLAPLYLELRAAERHRPRPMPRSKAQPRSNMPYVEYTRSDEQESNKQTDAQVQTLQQIQQQQQLQNEEIRRQRAVAKKSTSSLPVPVPPPAQLPPPSADPVTSRVVYYTPKNAVKPLKMVPHKCTPKCKRSDVLSLKELRTYNPLAKPLLSGWERQIVRFKGHKDVMYRAPCGRRIRNMRELHYYLRSIDSDLPVDLFDFHYSTHCLAEFVLNKCLVGKKDLSHGKENVPVPCVNYYDDSLPEFCSYNTERTPTAGVPLNLDPEFLCGCDCTDDCQDKSKCACWKMTLAGARTIGLEGPNVGYVYKRLPEPLPSGIYECNSRCKCKHTCLNRVAQHPLQLKLQVFKTPNRGWGIRALNDVPKGSFLCVYAGNLLTDATANLDGLNEGDEYLAELDYIEVVEQMKEGYEEDIPEGDKKLDKKEGKEGESSDSEDSSSSEGEDTASKTDKEDDDFRPGYIGLGVAEFNKRLRKREKSRKDKTGTEENKEKDKDNKDAKDSNGDEDCITISDDEEVREPSRFMAQMNTANDYISKYKSVRTLFGKDEACYIMDAKVQGNIGRYLNHSCCPNVFVQNVFVDTHDPRFPWVAFFALSHIKAGTELTWNYNYDVGSVPGKILYCYCGAPNCRGRLL